MTRKGYWIATVDIIDQTAFQHYVDRVGPVLEAFGARTIVRNGKSEIPEDPAPGHHVIVEFDSYQAALDCYNAPLYQEMVALRKAAAHTRFIIIEGS